MIATALNIIVDALMMGGIYALIAIGLNIQWGVTRVLNMSHGEFIMLGAFSAYFLYTLFGISPLISLVICMPFLLILGVALHRVLFRHLLLLTKSLAEYEINSLLASYGLMFIMSSAAALAWGASIKGYSYLIHPITLGEAVFAANRMVSLGLALVICLLCYLFLQRTRMGKAIRATAQDLDTAQLMGINIYQVLGISFGLGAALAGSAGTLLSMMFPVSPYMGLPYLVIAFIVVVLGGMGSILGSLVGGFILGLVGSIVTYFQPDLTMVAFYAVFALILLVKPTGILGKVLK